MLQLITLLQELLTVAVTIKQTFCSFIYFIHVRKKFSSLKHGVQSQITSLKLQNSFSDVVHRVSL